MLIADTLSDGEGTTTEVMIDTEANHLYVKLTLCDGYEIVRHDDVYTNLKVLSAHLVSELMYSPTYDLLERHQVPHDSPLWDMNHSNPWR